ncbi:MAG: TrbI/VirB10 family protein [Novosphingobium sp.]|nr:TrbI/VirB10 family protein [Novosphingobium sp.]
MAPNNNALRERIPSDLDRDPRDGMGEGAEIIDLATRNVLPTVARKKRSDSIGLIGGIAFVAALGAFTLWSMDAARNGPQPKQAANTPAQQAQAPAAPTAAAPAQQPQAPAAPASQPLSTPAPSPVLANDPGERAALAPMGNPHASPTVVFDIGGVSVPAAAITATSPTGETSTGNSNEDFAARLGLTPGGTKATARATFDPRTTVTQGTLIPAILETAIDTDVPGYVRAIVSTDVKSFDGARTLVPRSSRLIGQYKSGLTAGQKRAYVIWTRLIRPDGVSVDIASPAVGFDGQAGLSGKVKSHFFERFGSAMLLSVIGGLSTLGGNASVVIGGGGQSAAAAAVNQSGQVGPTVRVRQGEPIRVFTAKDLDFSKVS